jgi:hypothetical protein
MIDQGESQVAPIQSIDINMDKNIDMEHVLT